MKVIKYITSLSFLFIIYGVSAQDIEISYNLNQEAALKIADFARREAAKSQKNISIAVLNTSGVTLLLLKGNNVGPHNTEASRRKAYTSVSTKSATFDLMNKAAASNDAKNLNTLPELLLLGGGIPIYKESELVGSIGVSGGGGSEQDHQIALKAVDAAGFQTIKTNK